MRDSSSHGLPCRLGNGELSRAMVVWIYDRDDGQSLRFEWDLAHDLAVISPDGSRDSFVVGDPEKATSSRWTVEKMIRRYIEESP
jgi:Tol biopolymer transport system component